MLVNGDLQRSQVCRSAEEWLDTADKWKAAMIEKGWIWRVLPAGALVPWKRDVVT